MLSAFRDGTFSTEEALNPSTAMDNEVAEAFANIVPEVDNDGYYLISTPEQFVAYRALFLNYNSYDSISQDLKKAERDILINF